MKNIKFIIFALLVLVLFSCKSTQKTTETEVGTTEPEPVQTSTTTTTPEPEPEPKQEPEPEPETEKKPTKITFGEVSWIAEQIAPTFWPKPLKNKSTMFISFHMPVSENVNVDSIEKLFIVSPKDMWLLEGAAIKNVVEMETKEKKLVIKRLQCVNGSVPLGEWTIELSQKDGGFASKTVNVSGLQAKSASQTETKKSDNKAETTNVAEDTAKKETAKTQYLVPKAEGKDEVSTLAVPVIKSVSRDADTIEIRFSVNDARIKNGYFWFDVPGEIYYRDSGSMINAAGKPVNGCRKFSTDGAECLYILRKDATNSAWFSKIIGAYFVVADVNRVQSPWEERIRSVSERAVVK